MVDEMSIYTEDNMVNATREICMWISRNLTQGNQRGLPGGGNACMWKMGKGEERGACV